MRVRGGRDRGCEKREGEWRKGVEAHGRGGVAGLNYKGRRRKEKGKRKEKKKYRANFSIIRKFEGDRVPSYNLAQTTGPTSILSKTQGSIRNFM